MITNISAVDRSEQNQETRTIRGGVFSPSIPTKKVLGGLFFSEPDQKTLSTIQAPAPANPLDAAAPTTSKATPETPVCEVGGAGSFLASWWTPFRVVLSLVAAPFIIISATGAALLETLMGPFTGFNYDWTKMLVMAGPSLWRGTWLYHREISQAKCVWLAPTPADLNKGPNPWRGPRPLTLSELYRDTMNNSARERENTILDGYKRDAVLVPLKEFDSRKPPMVLVHGLGGPFSVISPLGVNMNMHELTEKYQVFLLMYRDQERYTHDSGRAFAEALRELRRNYYPQGTPLGIVGHSMGGTVVRTGLNYLQEPGWYGAKDPGAKNTSDPRAGFGPVNFYALEVPWDGARIYGTDMGWWRGLVHWGMRTLGNIGGWDMLANSQMFAKLYDVKLKGVSTLNIPANDPPTQWPGLMQGSLRRVEDYEPAELAEIADFVQTGKLPTLLRAKNAARALAEDKRYPSLKEKFTQEMRYLENSQQPFDKAQALLASYKSTVRRAKGHHVSVAGMVELCKVMEKDPELKATVAEFDPHRESACKAPTSLDVIVDDLRGTN